MTSESLDLVRSIYADWERGDFSSSEWAHSEIEYTDVEGPLDGSTGELGDIGQGVRDFLAEWADFRLVADRLQELDAEHVLALDHRVGRSRTSGLELSDVRTDGARLFHIRGGQVHKIVVYFSRERAFADLGLAE
jgi:hypothetical protein